MRKKQAAQTIRQRVRIFLAERDMTQAQLAAQLGIDDSMLSLILHGKRTPSLSIALKLESITGIPVKAFAEVSA